MIDPQLIERARQILNASQRPVVLTGAGVSQESGVPTFRDALEGLWTQYDPMQLATPQAFQQHPKRVWDWYEYRREKVRQAQPNPGHYALAALGRRFPALKLITQNVDDLHERAGSAGVIRLHGSIAANKCSAACRGEPTPVDVTQLEWDRDAGPPPCPYCGRPVRPDVVWFGEMLPQAAIQAAIAASERADVMLVVGTSGVVTPAAHMPVIAKQAGAILIEVNPVASQITPMADLWLPAPSGEALPRLVEALGEA